jgi:Flp pilus assembly pilin Flp
MVVERLGPSMKAMNHGQAGQAQTEYGLILMLVAITVIGALTILGQQVHEMWHTIAAALPR